MYGVDRSSCGELLLTLARSLSLSLSVSRAISAGFAVFVSFIGLPVVLRRLIACPLVIRRVINFLPVNSLVGAAMLSYLEYLSLSVCCLSFN